MKQLRNDSGFNGGGGSGTGKKKERDVTYVGTRRRDLQMD